jgi:hypothetical protein
VHRLDRPPARRRPIDRGAEPDVAADGAREEMDVLQHESEASPKVARSMLADVDAVDRDAPLLHVVEAQQQVDDRRLAGPSRPDERDALPGLHLERHVPQHRLAGHVGEADVLEGDHAALKRSHGVPHPRRGHGIGRTGRTDNLTGVSSSAKIRSDDAIAPCRTLNFSDMSLIGRKKRCVYWRNATSEPERQRCPRSPIRRRPR